MMYHGTFPVGPALQDVTGQPDATRRNLRLFFVAFTGSQGGATAAYIVTRSGWAPIARRRSSIIFRIIGVKISCIASSIFPPGATMMFGRDMNESWTIESR